MDVLNLEPLVDQLPSEIFSVDVEEVDKPQLAALDRCLAAGNIEKESWNRTERRAAWRQAYKATKVAKRPDRSRKEASTTEKRQYFKDFIKAKEAEYKSWVDNDVFELVDLRKFPCKNFVRGRWVLTIKRDKDGNFVKAKARWVLQGFLGKQKIDQ